ncbi:hypothetical protein I6E29_02465 [Arcanobacterium haemolyticum]|nr:hypothetical protein [Arcanobacterium haemolyticum]
MKFETRPASPAHSDLGELSWLVIFPDVEELSSLTEVLPDSLHTVPAEWVHAPLVLDWAGHSAFDSLGDMPDAPEDDLRFDAMAMTGKSLVVEGVSDEWSQWFEQAAQAIGCEPNALTGSALPQPVQAQIAYGCAGDLGRALGPVLAAANVNFGRPRLALVRATTSEHGLEWKVVRSLAALTREQREEIEGGYRL